MEALLLLPTGLYTYPGAIRSVSFNAGTYYQWPVYEGLMWGGVQAALCCLRFFTDDRGRTDRRARLGPCPRRGRPTAVRSLPGDLRAVSACFFVLQHSRAAGSPCTPTRGRRTMLKRSYFNGGVCGEGTDNPCPDPGSAAAEPGESGYINTRR